MLLVRLHAKRARAEEGGVERGDSHVGRSGLCVQYISHVRCSGFVQGLVQVQPVAHHGMNGGCTEVNQCVIRLSKTKARKSSDETRTYLNGTRAPKMQ